MVWFGYWKLMKASSGLGTAEICFLLMDGAAFIPMGCSNCPSVSGLGSSSLSQFLVGDIPVRVVTGLLTLCLLKKTWGAVGQIISRNWFNKNTSSLARAPPNCVWTQLSCYCYHHRCCGGHPFWKRNTYYLDKTSDLKAGSKIPVMIMSVVHTWVQTH